jgi:valyl-tRNA synthetase
MVSEFPAPTVEQGDGQVERTMAVIMEIITGIRNIRGEVGVGPAKKLNVIVYAPDAEAAAVVAEGNGYIISLANLENLTIAREEAEPKGAATAIVGGLRVYVLLDGVVDIAGEKARLEKEKAKLDHDLAVVSKKLANRDFLSKAAEAIIQKEETKYRELREKHAALEAALKKFTEIRTQ